MDKPKWTVLYNIVSLENARWIGTGWEFFDNEQDATDCYNRHIKSGNCPSKRPYHNGCDIKHLGAAHMAALKKSVVIQDRVNPEEQDIGCAIMSTFSWHLKSFRNEGLDWPEAIEKAVQKTIDGEEAV